MEQISLPWARLVHPRTKYLYACKLAKSTALPDYIYSTNLCIEEKEDKYTKLIKDFINNKLTAPSELSMMQNCWQIFSNMNNRIFFESILFHHSLDVAAEFTGVNKTTCEFYMKCFFSIKDSSTLGKFKFYELLSSTDVLNWFRKCEALSLDDLAYLIKGKQKNIKIEEGIVQMFQRAYQLFMTGTQSVLNPETIRRGLSPAEKDMYEMGMKAASVASNLTRIYLQFESSINKDAKSFFSDWTFALQADSAADYNDPELPKELLDQMSFLNQGSLEDVKLDKKKGGD